MSRPDRGRPVAVEAAAARGRMAVRPVSAGDDAETARRL